MKKIVFIFCALMCIGWSYPDAKIDDEITIKCEELYMKEMIKLRKELSKLEAKVRRQKDEIEKFKSKANDLEGVDLLRFLEDPSYDLVTTSDGTEIWGNDISVSSVTSSGSITLQAY